MIFANRSEAGRSLARRLTRYANRNDVIVMGIPRGGVPVAFEIAEALHVRLEVFLLRKLGVPGYEEFAFGAIASGGVRVLDREIIRGLRLSARDVETVTAREEEELKRREIAYRGDRPAPSVAGQIVILVDDGIATGASLLAGIRALRQLRPAKIILAVPVAPPETIERLAYEVDEVVCVTMPHPFRAVSLFYDDFPQLSDEEVLQLLTAYQQPGVQSAA